MKTIFETKSVLEMVPGVVECELVNQVLATDEFGPQSWVVVDKVSVTENRQCCAECRVITPTTVPTEGYHVSVECSLGDEAMADIQDMLECMARLPRSENPGRWAWHERYPECKEIRQRMFERLEKFKSSQKV